MYPVMRSGITNSAVPTPHRGKCHPGAKQRQFPSWDKGQDVLVCTPGPLYPSLMGSGSSSGKTSIPPMENTDEATD